ncbi:nicastrin-like [Diaphorina citri]|uniref:Nicastrin-like n=1 Tax=Diaphorina citri TaxID=121845 RepID=A0A1S3DPM8_DIACI|nr:nicastrin-like [Diaphorina citri]
MNENWNFPIVIISDNIIIDSLVQCYKDHNTPLSVQEDSWHPLCGLEMEMGMSGNTNTEVCIRRSRLYYENHAIKQCDALGGRNIVYSAEKLSADQPIKNHSLILVTARLDSKSMFDGIVPGALSTVTSIVTLLSAARILSQARSKLSPPSKPNTNALFLLLDGEAYDYIGSSRVVYDMKTGGFPKTSLPIGEQHVKLMIELSQIASNKYIDQTQCCITRG